MVVIESPTVICFVLLMCVPSLSGEFTNRLHYYETLKETDIKSRNKRDVKTDIEGVHEIWLNTLGRKFYLKLKQSKILSHDFQTTIVNSDGEKSNLPLNGQQFYSGIAKGESDSTVNVYWEDKILTASILTREDIYFIEPSWRYLPHSHNHSMIAYKQSDIKLDKSHHSSSFCVDKRYNHSVDRPDITLHSHPLNQYHPYLKHKDHKIAKRAIDLGGRTVCRVHLVADFYFHDGIGGSFEQSTRNYMIGVVDRINEMYMKTKWPDDDSYITGLGFEVGQILIHSGYSADGHYNMKDRKMVMNSVISALGKSFHNNRFCVVHLFTYQPFGEGKYGVAYTASHRKGDLGGICSSSGYGSAFNVGVSTYMESDRSRRLSLSAYLTTAHGHNWGSEHDAETAECSPSESNGGKYIMYPNSQSGYSANNAIFSPCSRRSIHKVLESKGRSCFTEPSSSLSLCGNGRVDPGEQCDPGGLSDQCCKENCDLRSGYECSDINHSCCKMCKKASKGVPCSTEVDDNIDCKGPATCNGISLDCPAPENKDDNTDCIDGGKCYNGICRDYCEFYHQLIPCVCDADTGYACFRCCRANRNGSRCMNYDQLLQDGRPCFKGYCSNGQCVKTEGTIQRLWDIIQSSFRNSFAEFMKNNIVWVVSFLSGLIWLLCGIAVKCHDMRKKKRAEDKLKKRADERALTILPEDEKDIEHRVNVTFSSSTMPKRRKPSYGRSVEQDQKLNNSLTDDNRSYDKIPKYSRHVNDDSYHSRIQSVPGYETSRWRHNDEFAYKGVNARHIDGGRDWNTRHHRNGHPGYQDMYVNRDNPQREYGQINPAYINDIYKTNPNRNPQNINYRPSSNEKQYLELYANLRNKTPTMETQV